MKKSNLNSELEKTQKLVNLYIRLKYAIETNEGLMAKCYTCGKTWLLQTSEDWKNYHAGHYWKADKKSGHQSVRFNLNNIRPQCKKCNTFRGGMMAEFAFALTEEIGHEAVQNLGRLAKMPKKWTIQELQEIQMKINELFLSEEMQRKLKFYKNKP
jgi:uncharacterized protein YaiE (UPF0345 family)